jgi:hypothetical protein
MKSKNLVSLSVAAVFAVLSTTGLLIYFGQGNHFVEHTHAWFGVLFFSAAVFHIINNWSSLVGYSKDRKSGGIKLELIVPIAVVALFVAGTAFDWPVFKSLANAGKEAFGPKREPRPERLSKMAIDSVVRQAIVARIGADAQAIRLDTTAILAENVIIAQGTVSSPAAGTTVASTVHFTEVLTLDKGKWAVAAEQLDK